MVAQIRGIAEKRRCAIALIADAAPLDWRDGMGWTNVIDGLPPVPDSRGGGSDDVLCQDSAGNTFLGFVRRALDGTSKPYWTQSGADWSCLEGIVRWISMKEALEYIDPDVIPGEISVQTYVRFECGRYDRLGPVLGPYDWVQLTYGTLRAKILGQEEEVDLAYIKDDEWIRNGCVWSDVVIFSASDAQKGGE